MELTTKEGTTVLLDSILDKNDTRKLSGKSSTIISYNGCKKIATALGIVVVDAKLFCTPTEWNHQQHIWGLWLQKWEERAFVEGEASKLNTWEFKKGEDGVTKYYESTKIDSKYKSAMAYKRAYCKGVVQLSGLIGFYTEVEAEDFKNPNADNLDYNAL